MQTLPINKSLENILSNYGVSELDIEKAKAYQKKYGGALEKLLVNLGSLSEDELPKVYCDFLQVELVSTIEDISQEVKLTLDSKLNIPFFIERNWLPVNFINDDIIFLTSEPFDWEVRQFLQIQNVAFKINIAQETLIEQGKNFWMQDNELADSEGDFSSLTEFEEDKLRELASEAPTVNLLNSLISKGLKMGASDMHLEPVKGRCRVRFRVDGVLHETDIIPNKLQLPIISRLKILSGMDIAEKRRPQDGKIELKIANIELDIRVSALPLNDGESMVMRFLRKDSITYDIDVVGLAEDIQNNLLEDLKSTAGVVLLTGPTGSGKTTTLYTFLNALNNEDVKIITLEDPVEYQLEGVNQVQVNSDIGFTFETGLRSIVRQDPDVIMLGEIRDKETARIAMQSALTGHLVFSTVHTNDAPSAFTRLLDLGVEEFLLNAAIISIVAQRLARKLCQNCAIEDENQEQLVEKYSLNTLFPDQKITLKKACGCELCNHSGYKGRTAIIEYLRCTEEIKALDKGQTFIQEAKKVNKSTGGRTLLEDGLLKAMNGLTTVSEVIRVAG
ncbi:MAG: ATPase, T2SS/T4P/T4SS family [Thalassotalea sp.]|nr:ATPase, T2SS/T4P/T4SS family [Thalassotalea sp.]